MRRWGRACLKMRKARVVSAQREGERGKLRKCGRLRGPEHPSRRHKCIRADVIQ